MFFDDRGFPDQSDEFDSLLSTIDGGAILRKRKHPAPPLDKVDPQFFSPFDESKHGDLLRKHLPLTHLDASTRTAVHDLIKEFWSVFDDKGLFLPVKDYECSINTGSHPPISVKKIMYGPRESPIMQKAIASLAKVGQIRQVHGGSWMFKALLAPKPHQENVCNIDDFVWRFCVNYIPLNQITQVAAYPIPRCDMAVHIAFGKSRLFWLFDAPHGFHQLRVAADSQEKLAFAGPNATKWTYNVMPFGPVNGPATFIMFMHDVDATWKDLAREKGISIDDDTNTNIIVDDILSWALDVKRALVYMRCQLAVAQSQNLSLSLKKTHIFPERFEFVGTDVCPDGNRPAQSKGEFLRTWPQPYSVRCVARFVGFVQFYSRYLPWMEVRLAPLRAIMEHDYNAPIGELFTSEAQLVYEDLKKAILDDPCLMRFDHKKLLILLTDFAAIGFGYVAAQPADDDHSQAAMKRCMDGGDFDFLTKDSKATLHAVALGSRRCRGNEKRLHSFLGEGFAGDWAMNKCRHMCFGQQFIWVTDSYAIRFIMTYDGPNPAVLRLQMRFMCWNVRIVHRNDIWLVAPDYLSRLDADLCYDPLLREYVQRTAALRTANPVPSDLPMKPENMPYYRGPRTPKQSPSIEPDPVAQATVSAILVDQCHGMDHLANVPVHFGTFDSTAAPAADARALYNSDLTLSASQLCKFDWAVYGFNSGHFVSSSRARSIPFNVVLACDIIPSARALFNEFTKCKLIFSSLSAMLDHIRSSGHTSLLHGYMIHSPHLVGREANSKFWDLQSAVIDQLRTIRRLQCFAVFLHPRHDSNPVRRFKSKLTRGGWVLSETPVHYPNYGDSVCDRCTVITGFHDSTASTVAAMNAPTPPNTYPKPLSHFLWAPFDRRDMAMSYGKDDELFNKDRLTDNEELLRVVEPKPADSSATGRFIRILYFLQLRESGPPTLDGSSVLSTEGLCPPLGSDGNSNLFGRLFGIQFHAEGHTYVRALSSFEFVRSFRLSDDLTYRLSHPTNLATMDAAIPGMTSAWLMDLLHARLHAIRESNCEIIDTSHAAPAAAVQAYVSGAIGVRLPDKERWTKAYHEDDELRKVFTFAQNPSTISNSSLRDANINFNYREALRRSLIVVEDDLLIYREPLAGSNSFTRLQIVPPSLRNIIFVAFHSNPIGGHFNAYRTFHRLRLRYYWPGMYKYVERMCRACPGCALSNPTKSRSSELVYNFPIEAPWNVIHVDAYQCGKSQGFEGSEVYVIALCGMCTFSSVESVATANATTFASALMKLQLRFGFSHTIVLDKDKKFYSVFRESCELLKLNTHTLSGGNHDPMLVERFNRYLNKGLKIMVNERDTIRCALECILLLAYAWNSIPVPGTDISRSMVCVGREFQFPIDFAAGKHWQLTSTPSTVQSYAKDLATRLSSCREIAELLVAEQRAWHRELIASHRPDPRLFNVGDIVFARRATQSDARRGVVGKVRYAFTGPWRVVSKLSGSSYELEHVTHPGRREKKAAPDLSPFPAQLVPSLPVDGPDNQYGQLYKPIKPNPYHEAGIEGFTPPSPFKAQASFLHVGAADQFIFPSLSELNDDICPYPWQTEQEKEQYLAGDHIEPAPVMYTGPPPSPPATVDPTIPPLPSLITSIVASSDRLFFISFPIGRNDDREWRLVRVAFDDSCKLSPSCLQDGRFLVDFYILHPSDVRYNRSNQRYWLQYHPMGDITSPSLDTSAHLIRPSDTSADYASRHKLVPFRRWVTLPNADTFIHGPFEFATIRGRKTRDRISEEAWTALSRSAGAFINQIPRADLPTYSIHVDAGIHTTHVDKSISQLLFTTADVQDRLYL